MDVEDYLLTLPRDEQLILRFLRRLILDQDSRIREHLSYGVPFFSRNRRVFFLWPASAALAPVTPPHLPKPKVIMGFCYGNLMSNDQKLLEADNRKSVYVIRFQSIVDVNESVLRALIMEALLIDDEFIRKKRKTRTMN